MFRVSEIFGNATDLPLGEHTVDTAGQTLATFAIFQLAELQFSPRTRTPARCKALHEYGRLVRTIYGCRYVADEELRRRMRRQPNNYVPVPIDPPALLCPWP